MVWGTVEPRDVDGVLLEGLRLEQLAEVLDGGADLAHDAGLFERRAGGEEVAELRGGVLVHAAVGGDREVAPHLWATAMVIGLGSGSGPQG